MEDYWVDVVYGPNNPDSFIIKDPPESLPTSSYVGFVAPKKEKPMPEPIKTPLGAEVRVFVTTPDTWLVPAGSVMLQMSIRDDPSRFRQAEVVLSQENIEELIKKLRDVLSPPKTAAERAERLRSINEERRASADGGHLWRTITVAGEGLKEECINCGIWKSSGSIDRCPAAPRGV